MAAVEAEWDAGAPPPERVRRRRSAGRQFESVALEGAGPNQPAPVKPSQTGAQKPEAPAKKIPKEGTKAHAAHVKREAGKAATAESERQQTETSVKQRQDWEASPVGQERMKDVVDYATEQHNKLARERPELGLKEQDRLKLTHQQAYEHYGFGEHHQPGKPTMYDEQLPGMEDPQARPRPKRWEEHTPEEQAKTLEEVKRAGGVGPEEMEKSFGAQLDQGYIRARTHGASDPFAQSFYTHGEAAQQLKDTSERHGVSMGLTAAVNADTSPNMLFRTESKKTGEVRYPNAERADHIIRHIVAGKHPDDYTMDDPKHPLTGQARSGFGGNIAKALERAHKVVHEGKSISESEAGTSGESGFGPKTGAYHNAWLGGTPQFFVSDVHSGGGGMLPHQSTSKAKGDKSQREKTIEKTSLRSGVPRSSFHALADYAARQAMGKRGLTHIEQAQAVQWGEEQIQRGGGVGKGQFPSEEQAYRPQVKNPRQFEYEPGKFEEAPKAKPRRGRAPKPKPEPEQGSLF